MKKNTLKLAVLFHRIGPMHDIRLRAAASLGRLTAVEFTRKDSTYQWDTLDHVSGYDRRTLFPSFSYSQVSARSLRRRVLETLEDLDPQVVAIPGWFDPGALAALDWCLQNGRKAVMMSDSTAFDKPRTWWKESIKRRIVRICSAALVGGNPHIEYALQLGIPRDNVFTGYDVVDNDYFSEAARQVHDNRKYWKTRLRLIRPYFLASCRFIERKNIFRLMDAYASYVEQSETPPKDLVLLGDGELRDKIQQRIIELDLLDKIVAPGFIQYHDLPAYYALADVFVHASTSEQWGLVVNEAMASGLPVLVSNRCGCAQDLVQPGLNGFTFDPYNTTELADLMLRLASPAANLPRLGARSRKIIKKYSPEAFAENLWKAVDLAMQKPKPEKKLADRPLLWALVSGSRVG